MRYALSVFISPYSGSAISERGPQVLCGVCGPRVRDGETSLIRAEKHREPPALSGWGVFAAPRE